MRRSHLRRYKTTPEQVIQMLEAQNYCCPICKRSISLPQGTGGLRAHEAVVDHDHKTGRVRGMLCANCNQGLGYFGDNLMNLRRAADYLSTPLHDTIPLRSVPHPPNPAIDSLLDE